MSENIILTPWDSKAFGINTFEITYISDDNFKELVNKIFRENQSGHYTVRLDPLKSKRLLDEFGFYYCDTLIEPYCSFDDLIVHQREEISLSEVVDINLLAKTVYGAFRHGRFHRDFNLNRDLADIRYDLWLRELYQVNQVFGLMLRDEIAGFWGYSGNKILLHALNEKYRGKGIAKYFWSIACQKLFAKGYPELTSSISASNLAVLNLYLSLGFKFRNPVDVYHLMVE
jgi:ribosomal protein S18 acetylase RimI-like enzyme